MISQLNYQISLNVRIFSCRCVPDDKRAFAMGMQYVFLKTIGLIPGPIILGHLLDVSCQLWQDICGQKGRCFVYDVDLVSRNICIFGAVITGKEHIFKPLFAKSMRTDASLKSGQRIACSNIRNFGIPLGLTNCYNPAWPSPIGRKWPCDSVAALYPTELQRHICRAVTIISCSQAKASKYINTILNQ
jgi:hypothetical protein